MIKTAEILVVEDNRADQTLFREGVAECGRPVSLHFAEDGEKAMSFLRDPQRPHLHAVVLDLNIPRKSGREVLEEMKADSSLRDIPVIVLSTSNRAEDISEAYRLGACSYLIKANDFPGYMTLVSELIAYCFQLPGLCDPH